MSLSQHVWLFIKKSAIYHTSTICTYKLYIYIYINIKKSINGPLNKQKKKKKKLH